ncbi:transposase [Streptomyces sp. B3I8]|uniref:transposase n=1 Tax=Streptomyces sp. B3I8 TaxID=3042303 RepID=UPI00358EED78
MLAAKLLGHVGDVTRFPTEHHFASYTGTAPLDASSGRNTRHHLNTGGNRALNCVLHIIAVCQIRDGGRGQDYYLRKIAETRHQPRPEGPSHDACRTSSIAPSNTTATRLSLRPLDTQRHSSSSPTAPLEPGGTPPGHRFDGGGTSHAGPGGQRPSCRTAENITGDVPVGALASALGYGSESAFSTAFEREVRSAAAAVPEVRSRGGGQARSGWRRTARAGESVTAFGPWTPIATRPRS